MSIFAENNGQNVVKANGKRNENPEFAERKYLHSRRVREMGIPCRFFCMNGHANIVHAFEIR